MDKKKVYFSVTFIISSRKFNTLFKELLTNSSKFERISQFSQAKTSITLVPNKTTYELVSHNTTTLLTNERNSTCPLRLNLNLLWLLEKKKKNLLKNPWK